MICPVCSDSDVRASQRSHWKDIFQECLGCQAFRCRKCRVRFYAPKMSHLPPRAAGLSVSTHGSVFGLRGRARKRLIRLLVTFVIFAAMLIIFWFYLRYLTTDKVPSDSSSTVVPHRFVWTARHLEESSLAVFVPERSRVVSDVRAMYSIASNANIHPETAGRGKG